MRKQSCPQPACILFATLMCLAGCGAYGSGAADPRARHVSDRAAPTDEIFTDRAREVGLDGIVNFSHGWQSTWMSSPAPSYHGYRFPPDIIAHAVWLYFHFSLSFRDVEDLLAQRGITVTDETIRRWCRTFGRAYARRLPLETFGAELEREKARQRVTDAMTQRARRGHWCGGTVFGYDRVEELGEPDAAGKRVRRCVRLRIKDAEAEVVREIFNACARGAGLRRIAKRLNAEGAPNPQPRRGRVRGWAPSSVREVLYRPLYRGEIVWGKTKKRDKWGQKNRSRARNRNGSAPRRRNSASSPTTSGPLPTTGLRHRTAPTSAIQTVACGAVQPTAWRANTC